MPEPLITVTSFFSVLAVTTGSVLPLSSRSLSGRMRTTTWTDVLSMSAMIRQFVIGSPDSGERGNGTGGRGQVGTEDTECSSVAEIEVQNFIPVTFGGSSG